MLGVTVGHHNVPREEGLKGQVHRERNERNGPWLKESNLLTQAGCVKVYAAVFYCICRSPEEINVCSSGQGQRKQTEAVLCPD